MRRRWFVLGCAFWMIGPARLRGTSGVGQAVPRSAPDEVRSEPDGLSQFQQGSHGDEIEVLDVPLRIVSWNVRAGTLGAAQAVAQLAALRPDVALLEEVAWGDHTAMFDAFHASPYFREYQVTRLKAHQNGIAIVSRFPVTEVKGDSVAVEFRRLAGAFCPGSPHDVRGRSI